MRSYGQPGSGCCWLTTKFGRESVFQYAALPDVDVLVTDAGLTEDVAAELERKCGIEVIRA